MTEMKVTHKVKRHYTKKGSVTVITMVKEHKTLSSLSITT